MAVQGISLQTEALKGARCLLAGLVVGLSLAAGCTGDSRFVRPENDDQCPMDAARLGNGFCPVDEVPAASVPDSGTAGGPEENPPKVVVDPGPRPQFSRRLVARRPDVRGSITLSMSDTGLRALIGASDLNDRRGGAYLYELKGGAWSLTHTFGLSDNGPPNPLDEMGHAVAIAGDEVALGAPAQSFPHNQSGPGAGHGSVYVFERSSQGVWRQLRKLGPPEGRVGDAFGAAVALDGDTLVVGSPGRWGPIDSDAKNRTGAVFFYTRKPNGTFGPEPTEWFYANDRSSLRAFGHAVALEGDWALVGAPGDFRRESSVYVFRRALDGQWRQVGQILRRDPVTQGLAPVAEDFFGFSVALHQNTALVGAPGWASAEVKGAAFVYHMDGARPVDEWAFQVLAPGASSEGFEAFERFGASVAGSNEIVLVGAPNADSPAGERTGAVYSYRWNGPKEIWEKVDAFGPGLVCEGCTQDWHFGQATAIFEDHIVTSAPRTVGSFVSPGTSSQVQFLEGTFGAISDVPQLEMIETQSVARGQTLKFSVHMVDPNPSLSFSLVEGPVGAIIEAVDSAKAEFTWTPGVEDEVGMVRATIRAARPDGAAATESVSIDVVDLPIRLSDRGARVVAPGETLKLSISIDFDADVALTIRLLDGPVGANLRPTGPKTAEFTWPTASDQAQGPYPVTFRVGTPFGTHRIVSRQLFVFSP